MSATRRGHVRRRGAAAVACLVTASATITGTSAARAETPTDFAVELIAQVSSWVTTHANGILTSAYDRAPVLVTVLAAMLILPVTALALLLVQAMRLKSRMQLLPVTGAGRSIIAEPGATTTAHLRDAFGWDVPLPRQKASIRIGRHEDNDVRLPFASVHRHHAVIHRLADGSHSITDVSGTNGNGIVINGRRATDARLADGDHIQIGDAALTFVVAPHPSVASSVSAALSNPA